MLKNSPPYEGNDASRALWQIRDGCKSYLMNAWNFMKQFENNHKRIVSLRLCLMINAISADTRRMIHVSSLNWLLTFFLKSRLAKKRGRAILSGNFTNYLIEGYECVHIMAFYYVYEFENVLECILISHDSSNYTLNRYILWTIANSVQIRYYSKINFPGEYDRWTNMGNVDWKHNLDETILI